MGQKLTADTTRKIDGQLATDLNNSLNTTMQGVDASVSRMMWANNRNQQINANAQFAADESSRASRQQGVVDSANGLNASLSSQASALGSRYLNQMVGIRAGADAAFAKGAARGEYAYEQGYAARMAMPGRVNFDLDAALAGNKAMWGEGIARTQSINSAINNFNDSWVAVESSNPYANEAIGRQSTPGALHNVITTIEAAASAYKGQSYVNSSGKLGIFGHHSSNISYVLKNPAGTGFTYGTFDPAAGRNGQPMVRMEYASNNPKGHGQMWKASNALTHAPSNLTRAGAAGGLWGIPLAVAGTTFQYALDDSKHFASTEFAKDAGLDVIKGGASGTIGAAAGVGTTIALSAAAGAFGGSVVPVIGTAVGFIAGTAAGVYASYRVEDVYKYFGWR
ncbi:hypothetical protein PSECIP111951_04160 [Pseudoalteromonas holothuriae]|uniref:Uncharacterized protein n=2 Tax=Pseudoalteromonas holothuriae TaxID=2963714 RepID=A0ABN8UVV4_9GAMM|nr:hypothetical protein PSECIP111951_04160 [Pseudoalteromonas sp. CIP111951]